MNTRTFPAGTPARCNRNCPDTYPLPREAVGLPENDHCWRLQDMMALDCGHMDAHWVFVKDLEADNG